MEASILQAQQWSQGMLKLHDGHIPQELISTKYLQEALHKLDKWVKTKNQELQILQDTGHLHLYYKTASARTIVVKESLVIITSIPIISGAQVFDVFRVSSFPLPIHSNYPEGQVGYTRINNLPDYLAISKDREYYEELSRGEFEECVRDNGGFCTHLLLPKPISKPTCCAATMMNFAAKTLHRLCDFHIFYKTIEPALHSLGNLRYLFLNLSETIHINCPGKPLMRLPTAVVQVRTIPCSWKIIAGELTSPPLLTACGTNISTRIEHPMNLAIFMHLDA